MTRIQAAGARILFTGRAPNVPAELLKAISKPPSLTVLFLFEVLEWIYHLYSTTPGLQGTQPWTQLHRPRATSLAEKRGRAADPGGVSRMK